MAPLPTLGDVDIRRSPADAATAGDGTFINPGGAVSATVADSRYSTLATAGDATFINDGATVSGGFAGETLFRHRRRGQRHADRQRRSNGGDGGSFNLLLVPRAARRGWRFSATALWTLANTTLRA